MLKHRWRFFSALCFVMLLCAGQFSYAQESQQSKRKLPLSAGGGALFLSDFGGGVDFSVPVPSIAPPPYNTWITQITMKTPYYAGGIYGFFDAVYVEGGIGYFAGATNCSAEGSYLGTEIQKENQFSRDRTIVSALNFDLLAKYPFNISPKLSVFPLIGIEYRLALLLKEEDGESDPNLSDIYSGKSTDFSSLWFNAGMGFDCKITEAFFVRAEILYGLRLVNKAEDEIISGLKRKAQSMIDTLPAVYQSFIKPQGESRLGHGLSVKLAVGRRF